MPLPSGILSHQRPPSYRTGFCSLYHENFPLLCIRRSVRHLRHQLLFRRVSGRKIHRQQKIFLGPVIWPALLPAPGPDVLSLIQRSGAGHPKTGCCPGSLRLLRHGRRNAGLAGKLRENEDVNLPSAEHESETKTLTLHRQRSSYRPG